MNWRRWVKTITCKSVGSAYLYLSGYIEALYDRSQIPEDAALGLVYMQDGGVTYFFAVDTVDSGACLDIPLIRVEGVKADDLNLKEFTHVKMPKGDTTGTN